MVTLFSKRLRIPKTHVPTRAHAPVAIYVTVGREEITRIRNTHYRVPRAIRFNSWMRPAECEKNRVRPAGQVRKSGYAQTRTPADTRRRPNAAQEHTLADGWDDSLRDLLFTG